MKKWLGLILILFSLFATAGQPVVERYLFPNQEFNFPEPETLVDLGEPLNLWATNYYISQYKNIPGEIALLNEAGEDLGASLPLRSWCLSALEGTVRIQFEDGSTKIFNYHVSNELSPVDCSAEVPYDVSKTKFRLSKTLFGEGVLNYQLVPFRSIATDPLVIPYGTVLFIPSARGNKIRIGDKIISHDGYFFASDRGGAIKDTHIDVYTGLFHRVSYFPWVGHKIEAAFKAYTVKDQAIIDKLRLLHRKPSL